MAKRKLKFKAYCKETNIMTKGTSLKKLTKRANKIKTVLEWNKDILTLQYIGRKDKNGNEIYDGDIIYTNSGDEDGFYGVVRYVDNGFYAYGMNDDECCDDVLGYVDDSILVVGCIYGINTKKNNNN